MCIDVGVPLLQPSWNNPGKALMEVRDAPRVCPGEIGQEALLADEEWPTTQCFSRRAGEAFRGADYSAALEVPARSSVSDAAITIVMVIGSVMGAALMILWQI